MFEVSVEQTFAAGHALRQYRGKCENVHGHNYRVMVTIQGSQLDSIGLLVDFVEVKKLMGRVVDRLDHQFINDLAPFDQIMQLACSDDDILSFKDSAPPLKLGKN